VCGRRLDTVGERVEKRGRRKLKIEMDEAPVETEEGAVDHPGLLEPWLVSIDAGEGANTTRFQLPKRWRRVHCRGWIKDEGLKGTTVTESVDDR